MAVWLTNKIAFVGPASSDSTAAKNINSEMILIGVRVVADSSPLGFDCLAYVQKIKCRNATGPNPAIRTDL